MDGLLFDPIEYTDPGIRATMDGKTCRQCANRQSIRQGHDGLNRVQICEARKSGRTKSGYLRVRCDQPACILFTHKDNAK
jgi:hypothetical protein